VVADVEAEMSDDALVTKIVTQLRRWAKIEREELPWDELVELFQGDEWLRKKLGPTAVIKTRLLLGILAEAHPDDWPKPTTATTVVAKQPAALPVAQILDGEKLCEEIRACMRKANADQTNRGGKALNGSEQAKATMKILHERSIRAKDKRLKERVIKISDEAEFVALRRPVGVRVPSG
jgi:hypothetical protein